MYETKCIVYSNLCHYLNLKFNSRNLFLFTKSARCTNSIYINIRHWIWNSNCCPAPNFCKENNLTVKIINMQVSHYLNLKNMANNYRYQSTVQSNLEVKLKLKLSFAICSKCLTMWIVINKSYSNFVEETVIVFTIWREVFHNVGTNWIPAYRRRGHSLTACNAATPATPASGPQNGQRGLERRLPLDFLAF